MEAPEPRLEEAEEAEEKGDAATLQWNWIKFVEILPTKISYVSLYHALIEAPQESLRKPITIKRSRFQQTDSFLEREATIMELFPGCEEIVQLLGYKIAGQIRSHIIIEYAPHGSLLNFINNDWFSEYDARIYTAMILRGLSKIHEMGLVHCHLKPSNIFLFPPPPPTSTEDGSNGLRYRMKIGDLGNSRMEGQQINFRSWIQEHQGITTYLSPEAILEDYSNVDPSLDIWSLGLIVIEMMIIHGTNPWYNSFRVRESTRIKFGSVKGPPKIPNELSADCKDFLSKCFIMDPWKRWDAARLLKHQFLLPKTYNVHEGLCGVHKITSSFFSYN